MPHKGDDFYAITQWMKDELRSNRELYYGDLSPDHAITMLAEKAIAMGVASDDAWTDELHPVWDAASYAYRKVPYEYD